MNLAPLRDYQAAAVEDIRAAVLEGVLRPLLMLPTGGGKTRVYREIAVGAAKKARRRRKRAVLR